MLKLLRDKVFGARKKAASSGKAAFAGKGVLAAGQRVYAVGDIHGRLDLLKKLLEKIETDSKNYKGEVTVVMLGDYIDRGPQSAQVVHLLNGPLSKKWNVVLLKGNHEWGMHEFIKSPATQAEWLGWGGSDTLESYGIKVWGANHQPRPLPALGAELEAAIAEQGHAPFYKKLKLYHQQGGYAFVHAGVRRNVSLKDQLETDLHFMRFSDFNPEHELPYRVVFGHTIFDTPLVEPNRIGIDTGAYDTGILTAAVLEGGNVRFLQTGTAKAGR